MDYTELGKTGRSISVVGFGGMPLSIQGRPSEEQAEETLGAALDNGTNFVDTADVYCLDDDDIGHNERLIASIVDHRGDRDQIMVATKGGFRRPRGEWTRDGSPKRLREACEASLRALKTDRIFLYQLHAPDPNVSFEKSVETLAALRDEGKIEYVGLSNVSVEQLHAAQQIVDITSVQNRLNPYFREALEEKIVSECDSQQITFLAYSPLGGKRLSRKIPTFDVLEKIAKKRGVSTAAVTLGWVRAQGKSVVPIPGASTPEHALDSAHAAAVKLGAEEVEEINSSEFSRA
ncbi:MAG TPA: aldo/keto reductase [Thermoanaerobaculia bacterium]|nr:aldo/keto reductase [Thermoanaerobaculia bacterium]